ncbi:MAG: hypothetical protein IKI75_03730 [Lachnospiraceae bacterium]|nr:hypothetical protein [Lachnospiraceae bacterium]
MGKGQLYEGVLFEGLDDATHITDDYKQTTLRENRGTSFASSMLKEMAATTGRHHTNSDSFENIMDAAKELEAMLDEEITAENQYSMSEKIMTGYATLLGFCQGYLRTHSRHRFSTRGRNRVKMVQEIAANTEREALAFNVEIMKFNDFGGGTTVRKLHAGESPADVIHNDASEFSLDTQEGRGEDWISLGVTGAEMRDRLSKEGRVSADNINIIATIIEVYERNAKLQNYDEDGNPTMKDLSFMMSGNLQSLLKICRDKQNSPILQELAGKIETRLSIPAFEPRDDQRGSIQSFRNSSMVGDLTTDMRHAMENQLAADAFPEYKLFTHEEAIAIGTTTRANQDDEVRKQLYGTDRQANIVDFGLAHGYIQTSNSSVINQYMREKNFGSISYDSHKTVGMLDQATKETKLPHKSRFFRMVNLSFVTGALGIAVDFQKGITPEQLAQINTMSGKIITDAGYMSVGYQIDSQFADSPVMLTLLCDEGTPVMVTDNFAESELVFPRNTSYMILGVIPHNDQDSHKLVIGSNIQPQNKDAPQFNVSFNGVEIICKVQNSKGNPDIKSQSAGAFGDFKSKQQSYEGYFGQHDDVHRPAYLKMANADKASLTPEEAAAMDEYTTDSGDINRRLRGQDDVDDELQHTVSTIKGAMAKHPLPVELTTFRGVDDGMLTYLLNTCDGISPEDKDNCLAEDGSIDHEKMFSTGAYKCFEGCLYRDAAFVSTSTNRFFAKRWANDITNDGLARKYQRMADAETDPTRKKELKKQASITGDKGSKAHFQDITGSHIFIMNLKKGTRGMFSDTMYTKNGVGRGQDEFTLDSGYMYKITNVTPAAKGQYEFTVEVVL